MTPWQPDYQISGKARGWAVRTQPQVTDRPLIHIEVLGDIEIETEVYVSDVSANLEDVPTQFTVSIDGGASTVNVEEEQTVTVIADISNEGSEGEQDIRLEINGLEEDVEPAFTVGALQTEQVSLQWQTEGGDAGSYTATVLSDDDSDEISINVDALPAGDLGGTVSSSGSLVSGIEAATVTVVGDGSNDTTDSQGAYLIEGLDADTYDVEATHSNYDPSTETDVEVGGGGVTTQNFTLNPLDGAISGEISTQNDDYLLSGVSVSTGTSSDISDSSGQYTLADVDGDESHVVTATLDGYEDEQRSVNVFADQESDNEDIDMLESLKHYVYFSNSDGGVESNTNRAASGDNDTILESVGTPGDGTFVTTDPAERSFYLGAGDIVGKMSYDTGSGDWNEDWVVNLDLGTETPVIRGLEASGNYLFVAYNEESGGSVTGNHVEIFDPSNGTPFSSAGTQYDGRGMVDVVVGDNSTLFAILSGNNVPDDAIHRFVVDTNDDTITEQGIFNSNEDLNAISADDTYIYLADDSGFVTRILRSDVSQTESIGPVQEIPLSISTGADHVFVSYTNGTIAKIHKDPWSLDWQDQISTLNTVDFTTIKAGAGDDKLYVTTDDGSAYRLRDTGAGLHEPPVSLGTSDGNDLAVEPGTFGAFPLDWE